MGLYSWSMLGTADSGPNPHVEDRAFPLSSYLMKPNRERQNMTAAEKLLQCRAITEHAFGLLKGRFWRAPETHQHV